MTQVGTHGDFLTLNRRSVRADCKLSLLSAGKATASDRYASIVNEHAGAADRIILQRRQGFVSFLKIKSLHMRSHGNGSSFHKKLATILARVVSNASQNAFAVNERIIKGWNSTHVDAAKNNRSTFPDRLQRSGDELTCWREDDGRIQLHGWLLGRIPNPHRPQFLG